MGGSKAVTSVTQIDRRGAAVSADLIRSHRHSFFVHTGGGVICGSGCLPASARPDPASRLIARTSMS
jgi:hypothetical protein